MTRLPILTPPTEEPALVGKCALAVMIKAPRPGQSKTRLTPPLSPPQAAALSRCFFRDTMANLVAASMTDPFGVPVAVYTPQGSEDEIAALTAPGTFLMAQRPLGLGQRLESAARDLFCVGCAAVVLIGSDSPTVPAACYAELLAYLRRRPAGMVLGPTSDGGYYLIGLGSFQAAIFNGVSWSTGQVFAQTLANALSNGVDPYVLPAWYDVDDMAGLHELHSELTGLKARPGSVPAPHTSRYLAQLEASGILAHSVR